MISLNTQHPESHGRRKVCDKLADSSASASLQLTNMTCWAHLMLEPVLAPGVLAVDLTAGNGHDTMFLWSRVGAKGQVVAFDIQAQALLNTSRRLLDAGATVHRLDPGQPVKLHGGGVFLLQACHSCLAQLLDKHPMAVMANLGYLPGGDHGLITHRETTLNALHGAAELLAVGGRLVVTAYPGHAGGAEESRTVQDFFASFDARQWLVLNFCSTNRPQAPLLLVAEKRRAGV